MLEIKIPKDKVFHADVSGRVLYEDLESVDNQCSFMLVVWILWIEV